MKKSALLFVIVFSLLACDGVTNRPDVLSTYDSAHYEKVSINYEILGNKNAPTILFIHDWNLNMRYWDQQVEALSPHYNILNLDLAGHGNSGRDRTHWTVESFAKDIVNILEKEALSDVIIVGHSLGADIGLQVRELAPMRVSGLIGVNAFREVAFEVNEYFRENFVTHLARFKKNYAEMADEYVRQNIRTSDKDLINTIVRDYREADPKIALSIYRNLVPKYEQEKFLLQRLPFQLHIIAGDFTTFNENALRKYTRSGYMIHWMTDAGQFPMVEQPNEFTRILGQIIEEIRH